MDQIDWNFTPRSDITCRGPLRVEAGSCRRCARSLGHVSRPGHTFNERPLSYYSWRSLVFLYKTNLDLGSELVILLVRCFLWFLHHKKKCKQIVRRGHNTDRPCLRRGKNPTKHQLRTSNTFVSDVLNTKESRYRLGILIHSRPVIISFRIIGRTINHFLLPWCRMWMTSSLWRSRESWIFFVKTKTKIYIQEFFLYIFKIFFLYIYIQEFFSHIFKNYFFHIFKKFFFI